MSNFDTLKYIEVQRELSNNILKINFWRNQANHAVPILQVQDEQVEQVYYQDEVYDERTAGCPDRF